MLSALFGLGWLAANVPGHRRFRAALQRPGETQRALLLAGLRRNRDTAFGRVHGFASIASYEQYAARVPPRGYDEQSPWIRRVRAGEPNVLTAGPVLALEPTGGSSAEPRLIPYTARLQAELRRAVAPWLVDLALGRPGLSTGRAYWSVSPAAGFPLPAGEAALPVGFEDDAAYLGGAWRRLVARTLVGPPELRLVGDLESFRYATVLCLLRAADLALVSVWHPSFLALLLEALERHFDALVADVAAGGLRPPGALPEPAERALQARPDPQRARALRAAGPREPARLWPRLRLVSCWADGHAATHVPALRARLGPAIEVQPKGLLATEGVVTIPLAGRHPLALRSHFFEFEAGQRIVTAEALEEGGVYSVILTTGGGLYRYRLGDRVRVDGFVGRTPSLRFLGREGLCCDLVGEKLDEAFVAAALAPVVAAAGARFALLAPDPGGGRAGYTLFVEAAAPPGALAELVQRGLEGNPHYAYATRLGQLGPARAFRIDGDGYGQYLERCRAAGQRPGDVKALALSPRPDWASAFAGAYLPGERS